MSLYVIQHSGTFTNRNLYRCKHSSNIHFYTYLRNVLCLSSKFGLNDRLCWIRKVEYSFISRHLESTTYKYGQIIMHIPRILYCM
jgi:hypothetical protein